MVKVSAFFAAKNIAQAGESADKNALYRQVGLTEEAALDPSATIEAEEYFGLLEALAAHDPDGASFHMRTSASMRAEEFGAVGLAFKAAPTLRQSFERMDRYARVFNTFSAFSLSHEGGDVRWTHYSPVPPRLGLFLSVEAGLGTFVSLCREALGVRCTPKAVQFRHELVSNRAALDDYFGCPIEFGAETSAIVFPRERMDLPNKLGDESIWKFFSDHLAEQIPDPELEQWDRQVRKHVADMLSDGVPSLNDVADQLGLGSRTLQRRLAACGKSYQSLVEEVRRALALQLVATPRYSFSEIAFLTGFSEQSSFTRAFKRWSGETPRAYRTANAVPRAANAETAANAIETRPS